MNAQLEILAALATTYFPKTETSGEYWTFDKEKFAELIITECINTIRDLDDPEILEDWDRGYSAGIGSATSALKMHFGVEV